MIKISFVLIALCLGAMAYVGTDTDADGVDDTYVIEIGGTSYTANHCVT